MDARRETPSQPLLLVGALLAQLYVAREFVQNDSEAEGHLASQGPDSLASVLQLPGCARLTMLSSPGTEFVVVEDVSCFDTNAIILKGTTVLTYKPRFVDRPFSGSLFGIEVRSLCWLQPCTLGSREKHPRKGFAS